MEDKTAQLPWEALKHTERDIPWSALYKFAAEVVVEPSVVDALIELYEQALESGYDNEHYEEYYVPAIFALSAPQLSDERRSEIGEFLVEKHAFWSEQRKGANGDGGKEPEDWFWSAGELGLQFIRLSPVALGLLFVPVTWLGRDGLRAGCREVRLEVLGSSRAGKRA